MPPRLLALAVAFLAIAFPACGDDDDDEGAQQPAQTTEQAAAPEGTYVGRVTGTDAYIAVVADEGKLSGYVCDSKKVSVWLTSPRVRGDTAKLDSRQGDPLGDVLVKAHYDVLVRFAGETATGTIEIAGQGRTFTLKRATGEAGLYRAAKVEKKDGKLSKGEVEVGWVVLADSSRRGGTNFVNPASTEITTQPAPKLDPGAANVNVNVGAGNAVKLAQQRVQGFISPIVGLEPRWG